MNSIEMFNISTFVYLAGSSVFLWHLISRGSNARIIAIFLTAIGALFNTAGLIVRGMEALRTLPVDERSITLSKLYTLFPVTNLYESLIFFAWSTIIIYFVLEALYSIAALGFLLTLIAFVSMLFASRYSGHAEPLVPALQSNWLTAHVITSFLAYAAFAGAFAAGILYLIKERSNKSPEASGFLSILPAINIIENMIYRVILFGVIFLTLGIVLGAAWANYAWGSYWSWDPKETWSLITWLFYVGFLHARFTLEWRGKRLAILAVTGFVVTIFCYLGVNLLLSGLHSYGGE
ncbi:MAG TPA: c-type cytochrome biogenesis protein CcsB [bacterium]